MLPQVGTTYSTVRARLKRLGEQLSLTLRSVHLSIPLVILAALALAGIQRGATIRIGAGLQLWLCLGGLAISLSVYKGWPKRLSSFSLVLFLFGLVGLITSLLSLTLGVMPAGSSARLVYVYDERLKLLIDAVRIIVSLSFVVLLIEYSRKNNEFLKRAAQCFLLGGALPIVYGIYSFVVVRLQLNYLLFPGTWGREGRQHSQRVASFFYEPSQFGFYCACMLLLAFVLYELRIIGKKSLYFSCAGFLSGIALSTSGAGAYALIIGLAATVVFSLRAIPQFMNYCLPLVPFGFAYFFVVSNDSYLMRAWRHLRYQAYRYDYFNSAPARVEESLSTIWTVPPESPLLGFGLGSSYLSGTWGFYHKFFSEFGLFGVLALFVVASFLFFQFFLSEWQSRKLRAWAFGLSVCFFAGLIKYDEIGHLWLWVILFFLLWAIPHFRRMELQGAAENLARGER